MHMRRGKMKIEVLEERLRAKDRETGQHYSLEKGDRITVSDATGKRWCDAGWVKDVEEKYETKERVPGAQRIRPQASRHTAKKGA
jgi:hypothetical protein